MLPILGLAVAAASTLTAGQAALIGGSLGAAAIFGTNALKQKNEMRDNGINSGYGKDNGYELGKEIINEAVNEALRIVKERHNI